MFTCVQTFTASSGVTLRLGVRRGSVWSPPRPWCSHLSWRVLIWAVRGWEESDVLWVQSLIAVFPSTVVFRVK